MPKTGLKDTTSRSEPDVTPTTQSRELIVGADCAPSAWRHPAEQALTKIAEEWGGVGVMAWMDGDVDITTEGSSRIEVREM